MVVFLHCALVGGGHLFSAFDKGSKQCFGLHSEGICTEMSDGQGQSAADVFLPMAICGNPVNEVRSDGFEACFVSQLNPFFSLFAGMCAIHPRKSVVVKTLDSHAESIKSVFEPSIDALGTQIFRVGLQSDFTERGDIQIERFGDPTYEGFDRFRRQQRWCSSTEIKGLDLPFGQTQKMGRTKSGFGNDGLNHGVEISGVCREVKIAVVAGLSTKWDMEVDSSHASKVVASILPSHHGSRNPVG